MNESDFYNGSVGMGGGELHFENVAQPVSHRTLTRKGFQLEPMARGLIRYRDRIHNYRVGMLCGGSRWFLLDPTGAPIHRDGWFASVGEAMNAAEEHVRSSRAEAGVLAAVPGYNSDIDGFREVA